MKEILDRIEDVKVEYTINGLSEHYIVTCDNGFGASIIRNPRSYGYPRLWELGVLHKSTGNKDYELCYKTPITNDVIGWLEPMTVGKLVMDINALEKCDLCEHTNLDFDWLNEEDDEEELVN